ncbi:hypothetical protein [Halomonas sp. E19]|uniref:hypothetical protein n=1 Tax=Halomonas sp. E19 TaxID=3397247 RepID=UPI0040339646
MSAVVPVHAQSLGRANFGDFSEAREQTQAAERQRGQTEANAAVANRSVQRQAGIFGPLGSSQADSQAIKPFGADLFTGGSAACAVMASTPNIASCRVIRWC